MRRCLPAEPGRADGSAGFTLLEVMIAVAVIALALVTLIGAQSQSVSLAAASRFETMAALLARWKMTDLMQTGYEGLASADGHFGELHPDFVWQVTVRELDSADTGLKGEEGLLKQLDLTVSLKEDPHVRYAVRTLVSKPPDQVEEGVSAASPEEDAETGPRGRQRVGGPLGAPPGGAGSRAPR